jgi:hypothetical protein
VRGGAHKNTGDEFMNLFSFSFFRTVFNFRTAWATKKNWATERKRNHENNAELHATACSCLRAACALIQISANTAGWKKLAEKILFYHKKKIANKRDCGRL